MAAALLAPVYRTAGLAFMAMTGAGGRLSWRRSYPTRTAHGRDEQCGDVRRRRNPSGPARLGHRPAAASVALCQERCFCRGGVGEFRGGAGWAAAKASTGVSGADAGRTDADAVGMASDAAAADEETLRSGAGMSVESIGAFRSASSRAVVNRRHQRVAAAQDSVRSTRSGV